MFILIVLNLIEHKNKLEHLPIKKSRLWIMQKKLIHHASKEFVVVRKSIRNGYKIYHYQLLPKTNLRSLLFIHEKSSI